MGFKWWGLTLEGSCREKTHRREPPLFVSLAPPLLWPCCIRTLLVIHLPLRKTLKHSRRDLEVVTSTAGAADRSVSTEQQEGLTLCESNREGCSPCAKLRKTHKPLQQNLSYWGGNKDSNKTKLFLQTVITSYEQSTKRKGQQLLSGQKCLASTFLGVGSKWAFFTSPKN